MLFQHDKKLFAILGIGLCLFCLSSFNLFYHLHQYENETSLLSSISSSSAVASGIQNVAIDAEMQNLQEGYMSLPKSETKVSQVQLDLLFPTSSGSSGSSGSGTNSTGRTVFPQSVHNEKWEEMNHPALALLLAAPDRLDDQNQNTINNKDYNNWKQKIQQPLLVPKFWIPPFTENYHDMRTYFGNYGQHLMKKQAAIAIGGYTLPTKDYDEQQPSIEEEEEEEEEEVSIIETTRYELPPKVIKPLETIFVSIISYRDPRCITTIEQLFTQALYPERLRVAIIDQQQQQDQSGHYPKPFSSSSLCGDSPNEILCQYLHLIDVYPLDSQLAVGPVFARHLSHRMYRGEYFVLQIDAHMEFIDDWDVTLIEHWMNTNNEMAILTTKPLPVLNHYNNTSGTSIHRTKPKLCNMEFSNSLSLLLNSQEQPVGPLEYHGLPILQPLWSAGFNFARGHFILNVPYDPYLPMIFDGEEMSMGLRAFTHGYDFYSPEENIVFHYRSQYLKKGQDVKEITEHASLYTGVEHMSKLRILGITGMLDELLPGVEENQSGSKRTSFNDIDIQNYELGKVRTVKKYFDTFGINIKDKTVEKQLCHFVGERMNKMFIPHLRKDGMGINYDEIQYKFQDSDVHHRGKI